MNKHVAAAGVGVVALYLLFSASSGGPGRYDGFAQCLTQEGFSMGGTDWCKSCSDQKRLFGSSFEYIDYHNCEVDSTWCRENRISQYPTWVLPDGARIVGAQTPQYLESISECEIQETT